MASPKISFFLKVLATLPDNLENRSVLARSGDDLLPEVVVPEDEPLPSIASGLGGGDAIFALSLVLVDFLSLSVRGSDGLSAKPRPFGFPKRGAFL